MKWHVSINNCNIDKQTMNWAMAHVIREAREAAGLTQVELADFAGLSEPYISGLERGTMNSSVFALSRISDVVKVKTSELMPRVEAEIAKRPKKPEPVTGRQEVTLVRADAGACRICGSF